MNPHPRIALGSAGVLAALLALLVAACHSEEPKSPEVGLTNAFAPPKAPDLGRGAARVSTDSRYHVALGSSLREVCKGPAPYFDFDSSDANAAAQPTMQTLATCMVNGPLVGRSIRLVGHTDPRGTPDYNEKLGLERAERVRRYLVNHGVDVNRIEVDTAGADDASDSPAEWPKDRRVETQLVPK